MNTSQTSTADPMVPRTGLEMGLCPGCGCIQAEGFVGGWYGWICGSQSIAHIGEEIRFKQSLTCATMYWRLRAEKAEAKPRELESPNEKGKR